MKPAEIRNYISNGFNELKKRNLNLFGLYAAHNAYFMKPYSSNHSHINTKLSYIIGYACGVFNKQEAEVRTVDDKEDYERSILYYIRDGGVVRFDNITAGTRCYKESGGLQETRTNERITKSAQYIAKK